MKNLRGPAFIFPAFISEFPEDPFGELKELESAFQEYLRIASLIADPDLMSSIAGPGNNCLDELKAQYLTYIFSCAASDVMRSFKARPAYSAGYSMGIYAAIKDAGVISFADGLKLIGKAHETIRKRLGHQEYSMCSVIGLSKSDIEKIIRDANPGISIVNRNSPFAFVLSGRSDYVHHFCSAAMEQGALNVHPLNVTVPYHSEMLRETELEFTEFVNGLPLSNPDTRIISLVDQAILEDTSSIRREIVRNLYSPLNWFETQKKLMELGVTLFIECGPGKSLVKNSKFIDGDYRFVPLSVFLKN